MYGRPAGGGTSPTSKFGPLLSPTQLLLLDVRDIRRMPEYVANISLRQLSRAVQLIRKLIRSIVFDIGLKKIDGLWILKAGFMGRTSPMHIPMLVGLNILVALTLSGTGGKRFVDATSWMKML